MVQKSSNISTYKKLRFDSVSRHFLFNYPSIHFCLMFNKTRTLLIFLCASGLVVLSAFTTIFATPALAQEASTVKIPLVFNGGEALLTPACLEFTQKIYDLSWDEFKARAQTPVERSLVQTINAMQAKDKAQLSAASHPDFAAQSKEFDQQANIYFVQFSSMKMQRVNRVVFYNDTAVFYVQLAYGKKSDFARFVFKVREGGNAYGFSQDSKGAVATRLIWDWFISDWGPRKTQSPAYCTTADFTHRVTLGRNDSSNNTVLWLSGAIPDIKNEAIDQLNRMHEYIAAGRMQEYFNALKDKERYTHWFNNEAGELERKQYIEYEMSKKAVFVFDLDPVFVVYTKRPNAAIDPFDVLFFIRDSGKALKLKGPSLGSTFNDLFQSKEFRAAAVEETPFKSMGK